MRLLTRIPAWVGIIFDSRTCPQRNAIEMRMFVPLFFFTFIYHWDIPATRLV